MIPTVTVLVLSAFMAAVGSFGMLARRNALSILMAAELVLNGANLAFVGFARELGLVEGHVFVIVVMTVAACEAAVGLALIINLFRMRRHILLDEVTTLKG